MPEVASVQAAIATGSVRELLRNAGPDSYFALIAYTGRTAASERALQPIRVPSGTT